MSRRLRFRLRALYLALPLLASGIITTASAGAAATSPPPATTKVVRFHAYRLVVPSSWPVFELDSNPTVCVRFNRHAVYLGQPSMSQRCPAHAVGRTEAILVQQLVAGTARGDPRPGTTLPATSGSAQPEGGSGATLTVPRDGVIVTATWHSEPSVVKRALGIGSLPATQAGATR